MNIPLLFVIAITAITIGLGIWATRSSRTASDFFVAGRSVNVFWNASAISGEYLSAASFMGIAGMIMKNGYDALWYPVGYAAGYLFLLLFIAGPLRRFGAYTIPDFAEGRFDSPLFRKIAVTFVLFIGFFYTMPQMKGAGTAMNGILMWPYWAGIVVVGSVITLNVALGGMKGITIVQAFQYWAKIFAISVPAFILMSFVGSYPKHVGAAVEEGTDFPRMEKSVAVAFKGAAAYPANAIAFTSTQPTLIYFKQGAKIAKAGPVKPVPGADPLPPETLTAAPRPSDSAEMRGLPFDVVNREPDGSIVLPPNTVLRVAPYTVTKAGKPEMKEGIRLRDGVKLEFKDPAEGEFASGSIPPNSQNNAKWVEPFGTLTSKYGHPLLYTYSLILALVCGTAGLPHILVRFYTNPDGRSAKRTTMLVMVLLGCFYVFPAMWGSLGRAAMPWLYANNGTDNVVIRLPEVLPSQTLGLLLKGITSAGAFAAFMSTFSGLLVSMSGAMAHDIYGKIIRPQATDRERLRAFKLAAILFGVISMGLGYEAETWDINMMVGWAFAIAAASYFPLLLLGSWWRGLTMQGAAAGMLSGGLLSLGAIVASMLLDKKVLTMTVDPYTRTLMEQPAIWGVPLALGVMYLISKMTAHAVPKDATLKMLRLHAPEEMGLSKDYIEH